MVTRKSRLAIQYARIIEQTPTRPHIFWVHAGTRERFTEAYREIADGLKLEGREKPDADILKLVHDGLRHESREWLMIVDNADDITIFSANEAHAQLAGNEAPSSAGAKTLLSYLPQSTKGRILVTTRSQQVAELLVTQPTGDLESIQRVTAMDKDQAKQLLRNRLGKYNDKHIEDELVNALDCIPLAIIQAAAFIVFRARNNLFSAAEYLEQFRRSDEHNLELIDYGHIVKLGDVEASHVVLRTWRITYEQIRQERSSAADLLSVLSFFHNQGIPEWVLKEYYDNYQDFHCDKPLPRDTPNPLNKDLDVLCGYSLITTETISGAQKTQQPTSRSFQMHALVQTCTRHWLRSNDLHQQWLMTVTMLLKRAHPVPHFTTWVKCAEILPHFESLLMTPRLEHLVNQQNDNLVHVLLKAALYSVWTVNFNRAESLMLKITDVIEKPPCRPLPEIIPLLWWLHGLRFLDEVSRILPLVKFLGKQYLAGLINSLTTPVAGFSTLYSFMHPCSPARAPIILDRGEDMKDHKMVILTCQDMKVFGFDNPTELHIDHLTTFILNAPACDSTARAYGIIHDIAMSLGISERYEEQERIYRAALKRRKSLTKQELEAVYSSRSDMNIFFEPAFKLARALEFQGKYQEAERLLRMEEPGQDDWWWYSIGVLSLGQKKFEEAEDAFRKALDLLPPETGILSGLNWTYSMSLGDALDRQCRYAEAVVLYRQSLEYDKEMQVLESPDTLITYDSLATCLSYLGEHEEAASVHEHCIDILERKFPDNHERLAARLGALLRNLQAQGKKGEEEYRKFEDRLHELGYELVPNDNEVCEELDGGSSVSLDGNQVNSEGSTTSGHCPEELRVGSTSTPAVDAATSTASTTAMTHDSAQTNLPSQNDEQHENHKTGDSDKPSPVHDGSKELGNDKQLTGSNFEMPITNTQGQDNREGATKSSTTSPTEGHKGAEMPTQLAQATDEPEDRRTPVVSETVTADSQRRKTKRKRTGSDARDAVSISARTYAEQPGRKRVRRE